VVQDHFLALAFPAVSLIYFSAFYALLFQIRGLIEPWAFFPRAGTSGR
jgi:hypothetical protein